MKNFKSFILEKLQKINSKNSPDISKKRKLDTSNIRNAYYKVIPYTTTNPRNESMHYNKMHSYKDKGSKPERLINSIKTKEKLIMRWYVAIIIGWTDCALAFRDAIIDRGYLDADTLDLYILDRLKIFRGKPKENIEAYLDELNIDYDEFINS